MSRWNFSRMMRGDAYKEKKVEYNVQFDDTPFTYWELNQCLLQNDDKEAAIILEELHKLVNESVQHLGSEIVSDAVVQFVLTFFNENSLLKKHHNETKQKFGNISFTTLDRIFQLVKKMKSACSTDSENAINETQSSEPTVVRFIPIYFDPFEMHAKEIEKLTKRKSVSKVDKFSMLYKETSTSQSGTNLPPHEKCEDLSAFLSVYNASPYSDQEFSKHIVDMIRSKNDLKPELTNYFGFENNECLAFLQENKKFILSLADKELLKLRPSVSRKKLPPFGVQVTVTSQEEKELSKQLRKIEKKKAKPHPSRLDDVYQNIKSEYETATRQPIFKKVSTPKEQYPNVFVAPETENTPSTTSKEKYSYHTNTSAYEEFTVPAIEKNSMPNLAKHVKIDDLDELGQIIFRDVKSLNMIQTLVFPVAYATNENMLICAPTGAGKTNIALLTIAHQIRQFTINNVVDRNQFKIVYVVPMKALAAEVTDNFSKKLGPLGIKVRELTGDMQLTKKEIKETQFIVTTPEKWDVITRKGGGDTGITDLLKLLIIDEIHLLHGLRGPVIEALVARTLRQVEATQSMIRIVGLSATLPNYIDVARFLHVNPYIGMFYFDARFRPVPLKQVFVGVKATKQLQQVVEMDNVCYTKVIDFIQKGHQAMVFVHARNMTTHTATVLKEKALANGTSLLFQPNNNIAFERAKIHLAKLSNKMLYDLVSHGFGIHHAGLMRSDRNLMEKYFREGVIKVLVCTATLAWGVNLPAHGVIIKGTEIYDSKRGAFVNLDILDVLQIFGRAGRPQFDTSGTGVIITTHENLQHYLRLLTHQIPIESSFLERLPDHLNAEIVLGTVSNVNEAIKWLRFTYLHQRITKNPQAYGLLVTDLLKDPTTINFKDKMICTAASLLDKAHLIRFNTYNGDLTCTDLGRTASHYYIGYDTIQLFNNCIDSFMTEKDILVMISQAEEFHQLKVRNEELNELEDLLNIYCEIPVPDGCTSVSGKVNILMQTYISKISIKTNSLVSDRNYVVQNVVRITRALFDIAIHQNSPILAGRCLMLSQMFELQQWDFQTPLRQFSVLNHEIIEKIERYSHSVEFLREEDIQTLINIYRVPKYAHLVKKCAMEFPNLEVESIIQPITRTVLRIKMKIEADFNWNDKVHGNSAESFWLWIEDPDNNCIYYSEHFTITKYNVFQCQPIELVFTVPLMEPRPSQYLARITNDRWIGCKFVHSLSFRELILPVSYPPHTDLLELQPLPVTVLKNESYQSLYNFDHFNPIQTQIFFCLYQTDKNALIGAPTGSGKTIMAELAMFRLFSVYPEQRVVYIAPMKALVRERVIDWSERFGRKLGLPVTELTGDVNPNIREIQRAKIIITTPEKWDGLSRSWQSRNYVKKIGLMIIDEIHLLGEDRGPVLEVIVSRTNFIAANTNKKLRIVGLSTAMANALDLANWLNIKEVGLFNFRPSVRPVPLEVHISGYPGKYYCPRMISMNKPTYQAIRLHASNSPALVFVSSRRQTRLTALDLIAFSASDNINPKQWLHMEEEEMVQICASLKDQNLKLALTFGIGLHHAGLEDRDRRITEELFVNQKIQILVATATLAWGVNFPAHLVVIKGTEYFDAKTSRYVDMPITDVLQMMGRAGRPQYDESGVAVVLVHDIKKNFYKKFLYEPFPVESNLLQVLPDHVNAEIVAGTITTKSELIEYLSWTYFFRRLIQNPSYYNLASLEPEEVNRYMNDLSVATLDKLIDANCIAFDEETGNYNATQIGQLASYYYLSNETMTFFCENLRDTCTIDNLLFIMSGTYEFSTHPVRHNEDLINSELSKVCRFPASNFLKAETKVFFLLQAYFSRLALPIPDYYTDTKKILEQTTRIIQAMIDYSANNMWFACTLRTQQILQMTIQACWIDDNPFLTLFDFDSNDLNNISEIWQQEFPDYCDDSLGEILLAYKAHKTTFLNMINSVCDKKCTSSVEKVLDSLPILRTYLSFHNETENTIEGLEQSDDVFNVTVRANAEYNLIINIKRNGGKSLKVVAPHFPKSKDEMWFLNLGYKHTDTLIAMKRVSIRGNGNHELKVVAPNKSGNYTLSLMLFCDSYVGLDQQYDINMKVI